MGEFTELLNVAHCGSKQHKFTCISLLL